MNEGPDRVLRRGRPVAPNPPRRRPAPHVRDYAWKPRRPDRDEGPRVRSAVELFAHPLQSDGEGLRLRAYGEDGAVRRVRAPRDVACGGGRFADRESN